VTKQLWYRKSLYFGALGAVGATAGWFVWIAATILAARAGDVWVSAMVGALVGLVVEAVGHYRRLVQTRSRSVPPQAAGLRLSVPLLGAAGVFVAELGQNSLGELLKEIRYPVLFSVITFFVGGVGVMAVAHAVAHEEADDERWGIEQGWFGTFFVRIAQLGFIGLFMAVPVSLVSLAAGASARYQSLAPWWAIIAVVAGTTVLTAKTSSWRAPIATGLAIVFVVFSIALCGFGSPAKMDYKGGGKLPGYITAGLLDAPDVPSKMWTDAEAQLGTGSSAQLITGQSLPGISEALWAISGCGRLPAQPDDNFTNIEDLKRAQEMCLHAQATSGSTWIRSTIVVFCFAMGLATATRLERRWRPANYESHPLSGYDHAGLIFSAVGAVVGVLLLRLH